MTEKKAKLEYTFWERGIKYGEYSYRGRTYTVCFDASYCYQTLAEQHRYAQFDIDDDLELDERI